MRGWLRLIPLGALGLALLALAGCAATGSRKELQVLVFSHTTGYRHDSIPDGVAALRAMGVREGFAVTASEDPGVFRDSELAGVDVLVLLSSTTKPDDPASEWLTGERRAALQRFVRTGGGVVAIHAAADSHYHWPWYGRMIGGWFARHPPGTPTGRLEVLDGDHPSTRGLPARFERTDEWYFFKDRDPAAPVLVRLDAGSIGEGGAAPIAWAHRFEGGRVFYTAMGHTRESYREPLFLRHVAGGIRWAAGREEAATR